MLEADPAAQVADHLHDELLPLLSVLRQDLLEDDHDPKALIELVDQAMLVTRAVISATHPVYETAEALEDDLDAIARPVCARAGLRLAIDVAFRPEELGRARQELVIRAVRELVENAARHARARSVLVRGRAAHDGWLVEVVDDGRGIDPEDAATHRAEGHLGHRRLRQAARRLNGRLVIDSGPAGTCAALHLKR